MLASSRPFRRFSEYRPETALADELPYWEFRDGCAVLADGTLARGLKIRGLAIETWDTDRINRLTTDLRSFLNSLPDGYEITFVSDVGSDCGPLVERHAALKGEHPLVSWVADGRLQKLREEIESEALLKANLYVFVYRRVQARDLEDRGSILSRLFSGPRRFPRIRQEVHLRAVEELGQAVEGIRSTLEGLGVGCTPLDEGAAWSLVYQFLNPTRAKAMPAPQAQHACRDQEFGLSELAREPALAHPSYREQLAFSDIVHSLDTIYLDGFHQAVITLKTLPEHTHAAMISRLAGLPFQHILSVHVRVPEQSKELSALQARRRMAHSMSASHGGRASDLESEAKLASTEELLRELINTGQKIFYFQAAILLRGRSQEVLEREIKQVLGRIRELNGAEGLQEQLAGFKVWKSLLPLGNLATIRPKRVKTDNLADFLPVFRPYEGSQDARSQPICLFRNRSRGLAQYDPFDARLPNYNDLVTGSSGAGKSFLNNLVLLQYMTQRPMVYIIDIGGSYRKLCEFLGGQYLDIRPPQGDEVVAAINPFELPEGVAEPTPQKIKFLLALLERIFVDEDGDKLPKLDKSLLEEMIVRTYETAKAQGDRAPRMSDLEKVLAASSDSKLRDYARMLYPWTGSRPYGRLLDGGQALSLQGDFVVFDLKSLSSYPDLQAAFVLIITDFILGRIESPGEADRGRRKRILMDEVWELLKDRSSAQFMEYCVRTLRKTGSGITFITQGLDEIVASPIGGALLSNTATKFILQQRGDLEPIRKILKLNDQEMSLIGSLRQVKGAYSECFLIDHEERAVIQAHPTPVEYWLATSDAADNALLEETRRQAPERTMAEHIHDLAVRYPMGAAAGPAAVVGAGGRPKGEEDGKA